MNTNTFWQSIKGSKKALVSGLAAVLTFVLATLSSNGGANLTLPQWLAAAGTFVVAHLATWLVSNEGTLPIAKLVSTLIASPTVTTALAALGITGVSPLVEPTALQPIPVTPLPVAPLPVTTALPGTGHSHGSGAVLTYEPQAPAAVAAPAESAGLAERPSSP